METIDELRNTSKLVEAFLAKDEFCRNSDKWLTYRFMKQVALENNEEFSISFDLFKKLPAFDSIRRTRQKIQASGRFVPTDPEVIRRRNRQTEVKDFLYSDSI